MQAVSRGGAERILQANSADVGEPIRIDGPLESDAIRRAASIALLALNNGRRSSGLDAERYLTLLAHLERIPGTFALPDAATMHRRHHALGSTDRLVLLSAIVLPAPDQPLVSVVIPSCIASTDILSLLAELSFACTAVPFEVILAGRSVEPVLATLDHLRHSQVNKDGESVTDTARGDIVLIFNGAAALGFGFLDELVHAFASDATLAVAAPKLIDAAGQLESAGGLVDGAGNIRWFRPSVDPADPRCNYDRAIDFAAPIAFAVRRSTLIEGGGRAAGLGCDGQNLSVYAAADLAFRVREAGHKVGYVAKARLHRQDACTAGGAERDGDRAAFKRRWANQFRSHGRHLAPAVAADRWFIATALLVENGVGSDPQGFGTLARLLAGLGYKATIVSTIDRDLVQAEWARAGIETMSVADDTAVIDVLASRGGTLDLVCFQDQTPTLANAVRQHAPDARTILFVDGDSIGGDDNTDFAATAPATLVLRAPGCATGFARPTIVAPRPRAPTAVASRDAIIVFVEEAAASGDPHEAATALLADQLSDIAVVEIGAATAGHALASDKEADTLFASGGVLAVAARHGALAGSVVLAAAARGLPVVMPTALGLSLGLRPGHDFLTVDTADDWTAALTLLMMDEDSQSLMGKRIADAVGVLYGVAAATEAMRNILERLDLPML